MSKTAILILAAGASKRLGEPKQLLTYKKSTLLSYTIQQLRSIEDGQIFVVVGAYFKEVFDSIRHESVSVIKNNEWENGMGSSLSKGIKFIQSKGKYDRVLVTLSDLPLVTSSHYESLVNFAETSGKRIILTEYDTVSGVPAVFERSLFNELSLLKNDDGAKPVIEKYKKEVLKYPSKTPYFDIDTPEEYQELLKLS